MAPFTFRCPDTGREWARLYERRSSSGSLAKLTAMPGRLNRAETLNSYAACSPTVDKKEPDPTCPTCKGQGRLSRDSQTGRERVCPRCEAAA